MADYTPKNPNPLSERRYAEIGSAEEAMTKMAILDGIYPITQLSQASLDNDPVFVETVAQQAAMDRLRQEAYSTPEPDGGDSNG
jgi:hypothetical protein